MASDDSDNDMFLTQSTYADKLEVEIDSEFEQLIFSTNKGVDIDIDSVDISEISAISEHIEKEISFEIGSLSSTIDSDSELVEAGQQIEKEFYLSQQCSDSANSNVPSKVVFNHGEKRSENRPSRFAAPLSETELNNLRDSAYSKNTENKSQWAVKLFRTWVAERSQLDVDGIQLNGNIVALSQNEGDLNTVLIPFITEVRTQKGEEYRGNTLYEIIASLQYHLRKNDVSISIFDSPAFTGLRSVLDARMKLLARSGVGIDKRSAQIITETQEDLLWEGGYLGEDTPQKVVDTLVYLLGLNFALRGGDEHRHLRIGSNSQLQVIGTGSKKYLQYTEDTSKANRGGLKDKQCRKKMVKVGQNEEKPNRCLVRLYEKYMSLRPRDGKCASFYLRPLRYPAIDGAWFADTPIGVHPLRTTVSRICKQAGLVGHFTNHSLRATTATRLYNEGVDEQLIAERTGHRSSAIRNYKRTSCELESKVDAIVQRKVQRQQRGTAVATVTSESTSESLPVGPQNNRERDLSFTFSDGCKLSINF